MHLVPLAAELAGQLPATVTVLPVSRLPPKLAEIIDEERLGLAVAVSFPFASLVCKHISLNGCHARSICRHSAASLKN
jgi:hypothetical protein